MFKIPHSEASILFITLEVVSAETTDILINIRTNKTRSYFIRPNVQSNYVVVHIYSRTS
jgi:hypothetical protein